MKIHPPVMLPLVLAAAAALTLSVLPAAAAPIDDFTSREATKPAPGVDMPELIAARTAYTKGQLDECKTQLELAKRKASNLPPVDFMLARLHLAHNNRGAAKALMEKVAIEHVQHPEVYLLFGNMALEEGRLTDAVLHFEKAETLKDAVPRDWTVDQKNALKIQIFRGYANVSEKREDWFRTQVALKALTNVVPTDAKLRDRLGVALFMLGREQEAFDQFQTAARLDSEMNPPEVSMAVMHVRQQETDKAIKQFAGAERKHPRDGRVHYEAAGMFLLMDQAAQAKRHANKAAELGLDTLKLTMQRGFIARQLGEYAQAEKYFSQVLEEVPTSFEAANQLAIVLSHQDDPEKKRRALELAALNARQYPNSSQAMSTVGWVYYNLGRKQEAQRALQTAVSRPTVRSETLYFLARVLWENGSKEDARRIAEQVKLAVEKPGLLVLRPEIKK